MSCQKRTVLRRSTAESTARGRRRHRHASAFTIASHAHGHTGAGLVTVCTTKEDFVALAESEAGRGIICPESHQEQHRGERAKQPPLDANAGQ